MNPCPLCRAPLDPRARFCGTCGFDLATQTMRTTPGPSGFGQGMGFAFGCLVALLLVVAATIYVSRL